VETQHSDETAEHAVSPPVTAQRAREGESSVAEAAKPPPVPTSDGDRANASEFWIRAFWLKAMPRVQPLQPPSFGRCCHEPARGAVRARRDATDAKEFLITRCCRRQTRPRDRPGVGRADVAAWRSNG